MAITPAVALSRLPRTIKPTPEPLRPPLHSLAHHTLLLAPLTRRHRGPPPLMAAAGVRPPPPRSPSPLPPPTHIRRPRDLLHPHRSLACSLRVHSTVPAGAGAPPPEPPPDLLLRRDSLSSEPLVSVPIFPSSSWSFFRANWWPGGRPWLLRRASPARAAGRSRGPANPPPASPTRNLGRPISVDDPD
jgi:hypothetical protein